MRAQSLRGRWGHALDWGAAKGSALELTAGAGRSLPRRLDGPITISETQPGGGFHLGNTNYGEFVLE